MSGINSKENSDAANLAKANRQKKRILTKIKEAEASGLFEITFFEEMFKSNKDYLREQGYLVTNHGGPQNRFYSVVNWKQAI